MTKKTKQQSKKSGDLQAQLSPGDDYAGPGSSSLGIPVVGIGGSAGSLEGFNTFFSTMPADSGAAFVVIQHLAPMHESLLAELLARHTRMQVVQAQDAMLVEPNCVYVIPPNYYLAIRKGVLFLTEPIKRDSIRMPIDFFFRTLAEDRQERAICILLSGAGSDGTLGARSIRGTGGLVIAQDPQTANFGDMPRSAIDAGVVDLVLSPDQMPEAILTYLPHPYVKGEEPAAVPEGEGGIRDILVLLLARKCSDFRCYKKSTIMRRIERRMGLHHITDMAGYYTLLRQDADEVTQLFNDLLINVTSFFRDAEAFADLREKALKPLVRAKHTDEPIRIWVVGCASGEEAYSLAMLAIEEVSAARKNCLIQVFATDIDEEALETARRGIYPEGISVDVSPELLSKYFIRSDRGYQIADAVRKCVVFAPQNLITDPPFSKMDLISCRNLLIYLDSDTQAKIIPLFNFALNPGGYLFMGKSEGIGSQSDLFNIVTKKSRIFRRLTPVQPIVLDSPILPGRKRVLPAAVHAVIKPPVAAFADITRQAILNHFDASIVLIDRKGQIMQFHGKTGKYLNMPSAEPNLNLFDMAKEGLSTKLRAALHKTIETDRKVTLEIPITRDEGSPYVRVTIAPAKQSDDSGQLFAVIFEDVSRQPTPATEQSQTAENETAVKQLEDELMSTRQELQATIEELQASNEEIRVSNEEVVSTNEELQSTIEELETSKEELQSVNEELSIVNSQLQEKVEKLDAANSDIANFLKSTDIATLFLDSDLRIKLFTPATTKVLKLIPSDTGRQIEDLSSNLIGFDLPSDARAVAGGGDVIIREVQHVDGSRYLVRIMPYRMPKGEIDGVIITFTDITTLKQAEKQTRRLAAVVKDSNDAVLLLDKDGNILAWNRGAQYMYGWSEAEALRMNINDVTPRNKVPENADLIRRLIEGNPVSSFETQRSTKDGRTLDIWLTATAVLDEIGKVEAVATTERDITDRKKGFEALNEELKQKVSELESVNIELEAFSYSVSHDLRAPLRHMSNFSIMLQNKLADSPDEKIQKYLALITNASKKMERLIDDLLSFSHIGRTEMRKRKVSLNALVNEIIREMQDDIKERKISWKIDVLPDVFGDKALLKLALINLVSNAVKYTRPRPEAEIEIECKEAEDHFICSVADNGVGFDMKYVDRLFGVFQRLHTQEEFEGTGIGLANVQRIISRHGGRIWAEGSVGQGATFYFTLPK